MLSLAEAEAAIDQQVAPLAAVELPVVEALGLVLAEDVACDIDSPPYDKAMMDGYAVRADDLPGGEGTLTVVERITAGSVPTKTLAAGQAAQIMTGAPLPAGADAVVMVEQTTADGDQVRIACSELEVGQHIFRQGRSMKQGEVALTRGKLIRPLEVGLLSEMGRTRCVVHRRPTVAILSTGDEIVPASQKPGPGQIRNSNGPMLAACVARAGGEPRLLEIARDEAEHLRGLIAEGLEADMLILSGGVSAGVADLVPSTLASQGVIQVFHKVHLKPGKPVWFGMKGEKCVFGLPGNPVSSLVTFELMARRAINLLSGRDAASSPVRQLPLAVARSHRGDRPVFFPSKLSTDEAGREVVTPTNWMGSADMRTLTGADCLAYFPPGEVEYAAGDLVEVRSL